MAVLQSYSDPEGAVRTIKAALKAADEPELIAQLSHNLSLILSNTGELERAEAAAEHGIQYATSITSGRLFNLKVQRAWLRAEQNRIAVARAEAVALLEEAPVRLFPGRLMLARLLLGCCSLFRGDSLDAVREIAAGLLEAREKSLDLFWSGIHVLVDAILDTSSLHDVEADLGELLKLPEPGENPDRGLAFARVQALSAQMRSDFPEALRAIEGHRVAASESSVQLVRARFLHQLGTVHLARPAADGRKAAADAFRAELQILSPEYGYYRARALCSLGAALVRTNSREARAVLTEAVDLARSIEARGVLAEALEIRGRFARH